MAEDLLATVADVKAAFGRDLTAEELGRVGAVLAKLSELVRHESGQHFTAGTSTVRVKVNGGRAYLRQRPVTGVTAVATEDGAEVSFTRMGQWLRVPKLSHEFVVVTYEHGGDAPELVRLAVADAARQVLSIDRNAASGMAQMSQTAGPYTAQNTYAAWAQGGSARLSPEDVALARSFRAKTPNVWVPS